ncbi:hypothetical protein, partial [Streptomyces lunaelactis]|uniref:hypothetical protein n=1 Tax=Streptomyces lunaelactis TaxID=1535768 RepID=UPI001C3021C3
HHNLNRLDLTTNLSIFFLLNNPPPPTPDKGSAVGREGWKKETPPGPPERAGPRHNGPTLGEQLRADAGQFDRKVCGAYSSEVQQPQQPAVSGSVLWRL